MSSPKEMFDEPGEGPLSNNRLRSGSIGSQNWASASVKAIPFTIMRVRAAVWTKSSLGLGEPANVGPQVDAVSVNVFKDAPRGLSRVVSNSTKADEDVAGER